MTDCGCDLMTKCRYHLMMECRHGLATDCGCTWMTECRCDLVFVSVSRRYRNFLQAASMGAVQAVPIATSTLANQIAFVSLLAFLNAMLKWFGIRVGIDFLTFKVTLCDVIPLVYNSFILHLVYFFV